MIVHPDGIISRRIKTRTAELCVDGRTSPEHYRNCINYTKRVSIVRRILLISDTILLHNQVGAWDAGEIDDQIAILAWSAVAYSCESKASDGANGLQFKPSRTHIRKPDK